MSPLGGIMEVILYVEDMQKQVSFYRDKLGLTVKDPAGLEDYRQKFRVEFDTGNCILSLHGGGSRRFGDDAPRFVFRVEDINDARQKLVEKGVLIGEVRKGAPGVLVCDAIDAEGNKFSLEERH